MRSVNKILSKYALLMLFICGVSACTTTLPPQTYTVEIKDMKFVPDNITVSKGDTIVWINRDMVAHDVTDVQKAWKSGSIQAGASWKMAVTNAADYYCSIHMVMKGKITLE